MAAPVLAPACTIAAGEAGTSITIAGIAVISIGNAANAAKLVAITT